MQDGALGRVYQMRQSEKHSGPHADWFYDVDQAGGGVLMDMGCHAFGWFRWMLGGNPKIESVSATMGTVMHGGRGRGEDNAVTIIEFEGGVIGVAEDSWAKLGGMDDRIEVYGTKGVSYADLFAGNAALTYSEAGYGYALEKAGATTGWTFTIFEEAFNQGYPQELRHFIECVREDKTPLITGEDGRVVLEIIYGAYESAGLGRKVRPDRARYARQNISQTDRPVVDARGAAARTLSMRKGFPPMMISRFPTIDEWADHVADQFVALLNAKPNARLCLPTGNTPGPVYERVAAAVRDGACRSARPTCFCSTSSAACRRRRRAGVMSCCGAD